MEDKHKQQVLDFIRGKTLVVVATINKDGKPEAVLVAFSETDDLEIIFGTYNSARKYQNLKNNPHVALVIGHDADEKITVQIEGMAQEMENKEAAACRDIHIKKNPGSKKYADHPDERWFKVTPTWIRYTDYSTPEEFEIQQ